MTKTKTIGSVSLLWAGSLFSAGCAFLTQVVLARTLAVESYGQFVTLLAAVALIAPFAAFGIGPFWLKAFGHEGWRATRWLASSFQFALTSTVLVVALILVWAHFSAPDETAKEITTALSVIVVSQVAIDLLASKLQLEGRYVVLASWLALQNLLRVLVVASAAFWTNATVYQLALSYAVISVVVVVTAARPLRDMYFGRLNLQGHPPSPHHYPDTHSSAPKLRDVAAAAWPFGAAGTLYLIYYQSSVIFLSEISGPAAAGIYNVAFTVMAAVYLFPSAIYQRFLLPKIHRWAANDRARFTHAYAAGTRAMAGFGVLATLAIWAFAPTAVTTIFGREFEVATKLLMLLAVCAPIRFLSTSVGSTLSTDDHMRRKVRYMAVVAVFSICSNLTLIPLYAEYGAATSTILSEMLLLALYLRGAKKHVFHFGPK